MTRTSQQLRVLGWHYRRVATETQNPSERLELLAKARELEHKADRIPDVIGGGRY